MPIAIEREPRPYRPAVLHSPQHRQAAQLFEPIMGIKERSTAPLCFLSEELKGSRCLLSPSTLFCALAIPLLLNIHVQRRCQPLCRLLICCRRLYVKINHSGRNPLRRILLFLCVFCFFFLLLPLPHPRESLMPHSVDGPLFAGLEACALL